MDEWDESKWKYFVDRQEENMILGVYHFLHREFEFTRLFSAPNSDLSHLKNVLQRTVEATGAPLATVQRIIKENKELLSSPTLGTLGSSTATKRKVLRNQCRAMIVNVYHFLKEEYEFTKLYTEPNSDISHLGNVMQRTADATGVSAKTVNRVLKEGKELPSSTSKFGSPMGKRKKRETKVDLDPTKADIARKTIKNYYEKHNEIPTLAKLKIELEKSIGFDGCTTTLHKLLHNLGYEWRSIGDEAKVKLWGPGLPNYSEDSNSHTDEPIIKQEEDSNSLTNELIIKEEEEVDSKSLTSELITKEEEVDSSSLSSELIIKEEEVDSNSLTSGLIMKEEEVDSNSLTSELIIKEEVDSNSLTSELKIKEEEKDNNSLTSELIIKEEEEDSNSHTNELIIKEEKDYNSLTSELIIKEEKEDSNSLTSELIIKEEKEDSNSLTSELIIKEEKEDSNSLTSELIIKEEEEEDSNLEFVDLS